MTETRRRVLCTLAFLPAAWHILLQAWQPVDVMLLAWLQGSARPAYLWMLHLGNLAVTVGILVLVAGSIRAHHPGRWRRMAAGLVASKVLLLIWGAAAFVQGALAVRAQLPMSVPTMLAPTAHSHGPPLLLALMAWPLSGRDVRGVVSLGMAMPMVAGLAAWYLPMGLTPPPSPVAAAAPWLTLLVGAAVFASSHEPWRHVDQETDADVALSKNPG